MLKSKNEKVVDGSINKEDSLKIEITKVKEESYLQQAVKLVMIYKIID